MIFPSSETTGQKIDSVSDKSNIAQYRDWFKNAVEKWRDWRDEAKEDYDFVAGKQWTEEEEQAFRESGRPAIKINRIKPLINVLSGYQRLNRYDIDFLPRTGDDVPLCSVRKGMTKYVMDTCEYNSEESQVFIDAAVCGLGWFEVGYKFDPEINDGEAFISRQDPFGIYVDPEARKIDFSDAKFVIRAKWVDKDELKLIYPEFADDIEAQYKTYDNEEDTLINEDDPLWYQRETEKVRLCECWYKVKEKQTMYYLNDGNVVPQSEITIDMFLNGSIEGMKTINIDRVKVAVFMDDILFEDIYSPYEHNELPFIPLCIYNFGEGDLPAGFVRDLKDPQREINKRRIQTLNILNSVGNGGGFIEEDALTPEQEEDLNKHGNIPGHYTKVKPGTLSQQKIIQTGMANPPVAIMQAEQQATNDLPSISGINEALMGTDIPAASSGRAIELKQKQAITHIAPAFDNLRKAKKQIATLLWGKRGHKGIIPQYYTDDKIYRVEGQNGQQFIRVNQQVQVQDPLVGTINKTLNDLSVGDFDIVVSDVSASTTQRQAQMWGLVDAVSQTGIPGDMVFDIIIDLSDLPNKEEIKQRWQERQQSQAQASQQQMQLEMIKNQNMNQSITFKDAPPFIQLAMAAKQGLIDPQIAQYAVNQAMAQMFPQLAMQQAQAAKEQALIANQQQMMQAQGQQNNPSQQFIPMMQQQSQSGNNSGNALTAPALKSLIAGQQPAM